MRYILLILLLSTKSLAANYYFSTSLGNDSRTSTQAQSPSTPWQTISKLNSFFSSLAAGDSVLFNRGESFDGAIIVSKSGTSGNPIILSVYGSGAKPIINGFQTLSGWSNLGGGVWESAAAGSLSTLNMLTINGAPYAMGRYPNNNYLTYASGTNGSLTITNGSITGLPSFVGGEAVIRLARSYMDRCVITGQTSTTVSYTPQSGNTPQANYGFFFQNSLSTLDQFGEWYYNPSTNKIDMYFGSNNPASYTIKASTTDITATLSSRSFITFDNLDFEGSNTAGISISGGSGITAQNCSFLYHGINAITAASVTDLVVNDNYTEYCNNGGFYAGFLSNGATFKRDTLKHISNFQGMMWKKSNDDNHAVITANTAGSLVRRCVVYSAGSNGIRCNESNNTVIDSNYVDSVCFVLDDFGGIYTWTSGGTHSGFKILSNVVLNSIGAAAGTSSTTPEGEGIYIDDNADNLEVAYNTSANCQRGIFSHNNTNLNIHDNTVYNCGLAAFRGTFSIAGKMTGFTIKKNIFFAKTSSQLAASHSGYSISTLGTLDSNYYCRPIFEPNNIQSTSSTVGGVISLSTSSTPYYSLDKWKTASAKDANSNKTAISISDTNEIRFEYNATNASKVVSLSRSYTGVDGTNYSGSVTLAPYSSIILLAPSGVIPDALGYVHPKITVQSGTAINATCHYELKFYKGNDTFIVNNNTCDWYLGQDSGLSWDQPLVFINNSTKKIIVQGGINAENCQYVKILGQGSDSTYGFEFRGGGVTGSFHGMLKGIQIESCRFTGGTNGGVWLKEEAPGCCDYYNYYGVIDTDPAHLKYKDPYQYLAQGNKPYDSIYFRHNKVDSCGGEGLYFMTTAFIQANGTWRDAIPCLANQRLAPTTARNCHADSNDVSTVGRTGIQMSQMYAGGSNTMNGNLIHNIGYEYLVTHDPSALNQGKGLSVGWHSQNMEVAYNNVDTTLNYNYDMEEAVNFHNNIGNHVGKVYYSGTLETNPQDVHAFIGYANNTAINPMKVNSNQMKSKINGGQYFVIYGGPKFQTSGNDTCFNNRPILIASTPFNVNSSCTPADTSCYDTTYQLQHDSLITETLPADYVPHDSVVTVADSIIKEKIRNKKYYIVRKYVTKTFTYYDTIPAHDTTFLCSKCAVHDTTYQICRYNAMNEPIREKDSDVFAWYYKSEIIDKYGRRKR